jgi:transposase-like protein
MIYLTKHSSPLELSLGVMNRETTMPAKNPPTGTAADLKLTTTAGMFADEETARAFLESKRWPNGPVCPHCHSNEVAKLSPKEASKSPVRPGVYQCRVCREQFTVRIGTIMEESKIPIHKWLMAVHLMTSSKKGISSHQIGRECGITQKSAWFMNHRIREAMREKAVCELEKHAEMVGQERRFGVLAGQWKKETRFVSNVTTKAMHVAYQKIIGMGQVAVPFILKDLQENGPDDWFWALYVITDVNPITEHITGDMRAMAEAWLAWGKKAGYLHDYQPKMKHSSKSL